MLLKEHAAQMDARTDGTEAEAAQSLLVEHSPSAPSALAVVADKQENSLSHIEMVAGERTKLGLDQGAQPDAGTCSTWAASSTQDEQAPVRHCIIAQSGIAAGILRPREQGCKGRPAEGEETANALEEFEVAAASIERALVSDTVRLTHELGKPEHGMKAARSARRAQHAPSSDRDEYGRDLTALHDLLQREMDSLLVQVSSPHTRSDLFLLILETPDPRAPMCSSVYSVKEQ